MSGSSIALDTTVVLRLLVQEPSNLYSVASSYVEALLVEGTPTLVSDLVLSEAYFALQHHYSIGKADALTMLGNFVRETGLTFTATAKSVLARADLATANPGFVDRLIHGASHAAGHTLVTFEKSAKNLPAVLVLR